ncbi:MAG: L-seryl-tRNA(Sec) selenium transferase [Lachnospiraceae bacterium]|nr:L-seryl-tRNA(Sec) selenium transferase [Lachnospiraceae bacterium]
MAQKEQNQLYRLVPNMNTILSMQQLDTVCEAYGKEAVKAAANIVLSELRGSIAEGCTEEELKGKIAHLPAEICRRAGAAARPHMTSVINGSGVILHTNLGRAPIGAEIYDRVREKVIGYSNLEYNLETHKRGERYAHFEKLLCKLTGAEAAIAVNNNAASVLLILSTLSKGGEALISRGELIEIGGKFRIPDVMEQSGTILREVGTTNKTHYSDYEDAVGEDTKLILKVHTSNYKIIGFTESVSLKELRNLADKKGVLLVEDMGSGTLLNLEDFGLEHEPTVQESVAAGADLVCFSGDKLLGGPQAGIIVGRKEIIDRLKKHPLMRAMRIDKFTAAALELTLQAYLNEEKRLQQIPVLEMLSTPSEVLKKRAQRLCRMLRSRCNGLKCQVVPSEGKIGGGSLPEETLAGFAVKIEMESVSTDRMIEALQQTSVPVVGRILKDACLLDMRTVRDDELTLLAEQLKEVTGILKNTDR